MPLINQYIINLLFIVRILFSLSLSQTCCHSLFISLYIYYQNNIFLLNLILICLC